MRQPTPAMTRFLPTGPAAPSSQIRLVAPVARCFRVLYLASRPFAPCGVNYGCYVVFTSFVCKVVSQPNAERYREQCRICLPRRGKDTGRSHKKILDTMDFQVRINNTLCRIYAHARGAGLMIPIRCV